MGYIKKILQKILKCANRGCDGTGTLGRGNSRRKEGSATGQGEQSDHRASGIRRLR